MGILIRPAMPDDAAAACAVVRRSIAECCAEDHHNEAALIDRWLSNKTVPNTLAWLENPHACSVLAEVDGSAAGFAMLRADEVLLCYLVPQARFQGLGKSMLGFLETQAIRSGMACLRLDSTRTALAFYQRNGFQQAGPPSSARGLTAYPMAKTLKP